MATANTKSTAITNADASPSVPNSSYLERGIVYTSVATVEVAAADDNNSVYRFCRLPSGARVLRIELLNDAITAGTDYNFGLYETAANGGGDADENVFADAVDLSSARVAPLDITHQTLGIEKVEKRIWELLAASSDPHKMYDFCATGIAVGTAAGTISIRIDWTV